MKMSFENVLTFVCIDLDLAFISHYVFWGGEGGGEGDNHPIKETHLARGGGAPS